MVLDTRVSEAFQRCISTPGCHILPNGCCTAVVVRTTCHLKSVDRRQLWFSQAVWGCSLIYSWLEENTLNNTMGEARQTGLQLCRACSHQHGLWVDPRMWWILFLHYPATYLSARAKIKGANYKCKVLIRLKYSDVRDPRTEGVACVQILKPNEANLWYKFEIWDMISLVNLSLYSI